jgi:hypothetical protein
MKKVLLGLIVMLCLLSCKKQETDSSVVDKEDYKVKFLFEKDGLKVYRFMDRHNYYYFTSKGKTSSEGIIE